MDTKTLIPEENIGLVQEHVAYARTLAKKFYRELRFSGLIEMARAKELKASCPCFSFR